MAGGEAGQIQLIYGPMFSGKSTELLRRATWEAKPADTLMEHVNLAMGYDVIGIDEGQFFPDTVPFCEQLAQAGKVVIVAALDGTFERKAFGSILELLPLAESVTKLSAVCMGCYRPAAFSKRLGGETEVKVIGGADKYIAVCRACYNKSPEQLQSGRESARQRRLNAAQFMADAGLDLA